MPDEMIETTPEQPRLSTPSKPSGQPVELSVPPELSAPVDLLAPPEASAPAALSVPPELSAPVDLLAPPEASAPMEPPEQEQATEPAAPARRAQPESTLIDLLRHGQVATPSLFSAPPEEPLGMVGWKQLTLATQHGQWDAVYSSSTRRCHDFARLLAQRLDSEFIVDERLCELDFGEWVGLTQEEIFTRDPELLQQYYFQPRRFVAPGGESMERFMRRVNAAWDDILQDQVGRRVLILTHTGVIRVALSRALDVLYQKSLRFDVGYARITRLQVYPDGGSSLLGHGLSAA